MNKEFSQEAFAPEEVLGSGWNFEEEQHLLTRRLDMGGFLETDLVFFESFLGVTGEQRAAVVERSGDIPLGARACRIFWENQDLIPARFKLREEGKPVFIIFDGTLISHPRRGYSNFSLYWNGRWCLTFARRVDVIGRAVSAVLKKDIILG